MKRLVVCGAAASLLFIFGSQVSWSAEPPPVPAPAAPAPPTLMSFLGIQQCIDKCKEHVVVHKEKKAEKLALKGGHCCLKQLFGHLCPCACAKCKELKKPPVKPLADPANLASENPAIRAAAEIKAEEDLAPQKIKALRYLSTIGCACYPQVKPAIMAALDDCTEEVRVEAALALLRSAGSPCTACNSSTCCDPEVRAKLKEKAFDTDDQGCWKEPSASVRSAAAAALNACELVAPPEPEAPPEEPKELPTPEVPKPEVAPEASAAAPEAVPPTTGQFAEMNLSDEVPAIAAAYAGGDRPSPRSLADHSAQKDEALVPVPEEGVTEAPPAEEAAPGEEAAAPEPTDLAGTFGASAGPESAAPHMIGDFFGAGGARFTGLRVNNVSVGTAGGDRRFKIVESNSPLPTDRVFFNYHFFANPLVNIEEEPVDLNRFTFGLEKTFFGDANSVELRVPFASGYNSDQSQQEGASLSGTEFGDLALAVKRALIRGECLTISAGLGIVFPTGSDWRLFDDAGELQVVEENEAVHLQPFLGAAWQPNDRLFALFFTQADFDASGNTVLMGNPFATSQQPIEEVGVLQDQALLFIDVNVGYWVYRNPCARWLTGIAPVAELHYSTTVQDPDVVVGPAGQIGMDPQFGVGFGRRDMLNLTGGLHVQLGSLSTLTVAGVVPLKDGSGDRDYDGEFAVQLNRRF
jgi:hypothetical protein